MNTRPIGYALIVLACVALLAALLWPAIALVTACATGGSPEGGWAIGPRLWMLLGKTLLMTGAATLLCWLISIPPTIGLARMGAASAGRWLTVLMLGSLLCPPMVFMFGWGHWWPIGVVTGGGSNEAEAGLVRCLVFDPTVRCVVVWALWAWPIPAVVQAEAWRRVARAGYEAARLDARTISAFLATAAPAMRGPLLFLALVLLMLFLGEYSVPHAGGLTVFATELLGRAEGSARAIDSLAPALPMIGAIGLLLGGAFLVFRTGAREEHEFSTSGTARASRGGVVLIVAWWAAAWALPIIALGLRLPSLASAGAALDEYGRAIAISVALAVAAGVTASIMAVGLAAGRALWCVVATVAIVFGVMPGALVGDAIRAGYLHLPVVYDHWLVVMLCYVARFAWVAVLIAWPVRRAMRSPQAEQARIDGATRGDLLTRLLMPLHVPRLICAAAIVAALAVGDPATPALVQVPGVPLVSRIIIEKFHRLEDGMLVSLSLSTVAVAMMAATVVALLARRPAR